jgi:hypothetical protein
MQVGRLSGILLGTGSARRVSVSTHLGGQRFYQETSKQLESLTHLLWHGNTEEALERIGGPKFRRQMPRLFYVSLQNAQKLTQPFLRLGLVSRMVYAVLHVRMNQFFRQRLYSTTRGYELRQDFSTIAILGEHLIDRFKLACNLPQAQPERFSFRLWMFVLSHSNAS